MSRKAKMEQGWFSSPCPDNYDLTKVAAPPGRINLFSTLSPLDKTESDYFNIEPGWAVLIEAYNMPEDQAIYLNRLVRTVYDPQHASSCPSCNLCRVPGPDGFTAFWERMTLGNNVQAWELYKSTSETRKSVLQLLVTVPGTYNLELEDLDMLGALEVDYMKWNLSLTPYLPLLYHAGISSNI